MPCAHLVRRFGLSLRSRICALAGTLTVAGLLAAPGFGATCDATYSYAGFANAGTGFGVKATLTALTLPEVEWGHVAGWVGVGGPGMGPNGEDEWIQVGFSGFSGSTTKLYYEVTRPGATPQYFEVQSEVPIGQPRRVAVLEMAFRTNWWRVWVDGQPVSEPVHLPGSHGTWTPMATAESWNEGKASCNRFQYRFDRVMVARRAGGSWHQLSPGYTFEDPGYEVVSREPASFLASATT